MIVDPLYTSLRESLIDELDKIKPVETQSANFNNKAFFDHFLSESRPIVIRQYAGNWRATKNWGDKDYLIEKAGNTVVRLNGFNRKPF